MQGNTGLIGLKNTEKPQYGKDRHETSFFFLVTAGTGQGRNYVRFCCVYRRIFGMCRTAIQRNPDHQPD